MSSAENRAGVSMPAKDDDDEDDDDEEDEKVSASFKQTDPSVSTKSRSSPVNAQ